LTLVLPLTAVILAAGRGTRMNGLTGDLPKGLLPALDKTFVSRAIHILRAAGIADIVIVTGFGASHYDQLAARLGPGVRTVYNPAFAQAGTMRSLSVALADVTGPVIVLDADILYESRAVTALLADPAPNAVTLSAVGTLGDEFLAWATAGRDGGPLLIRHLSKNRADRPENPVGEHIGMMKFGPGLIAALDAWTRANPGPATSDPYEHCVLHLLADHPLVAVCLPDLVWTEVDTPAMYDHARDNILPRLAALEGFTLGVGAPG
jgi:choline kinase